MPVLCTGPQNTLKVLVVAVVAAAIFFTVYQ